MQRLRVVKIFVTILMYIISQSWAAEKPGFAGCGDYVLKGVLVKNTGESSQSSPVLYQVNQKTQSQMQFTFQSAQDLLLVSSYLDVPTTMKVRILKKMDGTKGEIHEVNGVSIRKPNPLVPFSDSGIFLQSLKNCL